MATPDRKAHGGSFAFTSFEPRPVVSDPALPATARPPDLPGCEPFHLPESALDAYDGHLEFWDGSSETAWKTREPTSTWHERPTRRLSGAGRANRLAARLRDPVPRVGGSAAYGRGGPQAVDHAGRRNPVSATGPGTGPRLGRDHRRRPVAGRGAGGGPLHGRAPVEARRVPGMRVSRDLGGGPVERLGAAAGTGDSRAPGRRLSRGGGEPGVSGLDGGGNPPGADGGAVVGGELGGRWNAWRWRWARARERPRKTIRSRDR